MLADLARYARDNGLDTEAGFRSKDVKWLLLFKPDGTFIDVAPYGVEKGGRKVEKCPYLQFSGDTPMRQFLVDTAEYYALLGGAPGDAKLRRKHAYAVDLLAQSGAAVPELAVLAASLAKQETIDAARAALTAAKAKPPDNVTLVLVLPDGDRRIFLEETGWHDWWRARWPGLLEKKTKVRAKGDGANPAGGSARCLVTGEICTPALTHPKVRGLGDVGGRVETALVSFDPDAFRSYGLKQSANAPVSADAASAYVGALNHLIAGDRSCQRLGNVKVVHWYAGRGDNPDGPGPQQDPLLFIDRLDDLWGPPPDDAGPRSKTAATRAADAAEERRATEQHAQALARDFLRSVRSGERAWLADYRYYALTLAGSSARVMVRDFVTGSFVDLCEAVGAWFDDLDIVARDGRGSAAWPKFGAVLGAMVRDLKDVPQPMAARLWRCAVLNEPIPDPFAAQALSRATIDFIQGETPKHARMGLLRAHLYRKGDHDVKPHLNEEHPDPAYHCGRLLAVLDDIQRSALGDVGAGVVQRFYAAAAATPALVLGRLVSLASVAHLPKIEGGLQHWHRDRLARVWGQLAQDPPSTLSLHQQTLFAMGYYQQKAQPKSSTTPDKE